MFDLFHSVFIIFNHDTYCTLFCDNINRDLEEAVLRNIIEGKAAVVINGKSMLYRP